MGTHNKRPNVLITAYYNQVFQEVHYTGWLRKFTSSYHTKIEQPFRALDYSKILEVGANEGEHLKFVQSDFSEYFMVDISYPTEVEVIQLSDDLGLRSNRKVIKERGDAESLDFKDNTFDRAVYSCVLNHLGDSDKGLSELRRVVKHGGSISIYLPCDPGIVYRALRHIFSHKKQAKLSKKSMPEIKYLWSLEHKNHFAGLIHQVKWVFRHDQVIVKRYPIPKLSWNFNLYFIAHVYLNKE